MCWIINDIFRESNMMIIKKKTKKRIGSYLAAAFFDLTGAFTVFGLATDGLVALALATTLVAGLAAAAFGLAAAVFLAATGFLAAAGFLAADAAAGFLAAGFLVAGFLAAAGFFAAAGFLAAGLAATAPNLNEPDAPTPFDCFILPDLMPALSAILMCKLACFSSSLYCDTMYLSRA